MVEQIDPESTSSDGGPKNLADQLQVALAERDQFKENWARVMADLDNFRKRIYREMDDERKYQSVPALKSLSSLRSVILTGRQDGRRADVFPGRPRRPPCDRRT